MDNFVMEEKRLANELMEELLWLAHELLHGNISRGEYELAKRDLLKHAA
jgi:hypothetical protein